MSSLKLEIACPGCGRLLRLAAEHAGRQIRCPSCQQVCIAPAASIESTLPPATDAGSSAVEQPKWHVQTPEGPIYGPITWSELLHWAAERRIDRDCCLGESLHGPWRPAADLLPVLSANNGPPAAQPANLPAPPGMPAAQWPAGATTTSSPTLQTSGGWVAPHRGGLIFILGLLGLLVACPLFSFLAWVMGARDLAEIRTGRMDSSGAGLTIGGMILGIIVSVLWMLVLCAIMTVLLIIAAVKM